MRSIVIAFLKNESGASAAEYALILGVIAAALVTAITTLGADITAAINATATRIAAG